MSADTVRRELADGAEQILQVPPGNAEKATSAFNVWRRGVVHASSSRDAPPEVLLDEVKPKGVILQFLADFHRLKRMYQKQVVKNFEDLLAVDSWLRALLQDQCLAESLPDEMQAVFEKVKSCRDLPDALPAAPIASSAGGPQSDVAASDVGSSTYSYSLQALLDKARSQAEASEAAAAATASTAQATSEVKVQQCEAGVAKFTEESAKYATNCVPPPPPAGYLLPTMDEASASSAKYATNCVPPPPPAGYLLPSTDAANASTAKYATNCVPPPPPAGYLLPSTDAANASTAKYATNCVPPPPPAGTECPPPPAGYLLPTTDEGYPRRNQSGAAETANFSDVPHSVHSIRNMWQAKEAAEADAAAEARKQAEEERRAREAREAAEAAEREARKVAEAAEREARQLAEASERRAREAAQAAERQAREAAHAAEREAQEAAEAARRKLAESREQEERERLARAEELLSKDASAINTTEPPPPPPPIPTTSAVRRVCEDALRQYGKDGPAKGSAGDDSIPDFGTKYKLFPDESDVIACISEFQDAVRKMKDMNFSAERRDPAQDAFNQFYKAVLKAAKTESKEDDAQLERLEPKGSVIAFLVDFQTRRSTMKSRVAAVLRRLDEFDSWQQACREHRDAGVSSTVADLILAEIGSGRSAALSEVIHEVSTKPAEPEKKWVVWYSIDPRKGEQMFYNQEVMSALEKARHTGEKELDISGFLGFAPVKIEFEPRLCQRTAKGSRDVAREELKKPEDVILAYVKKNGWGSWQATTMDTYGAEMRTKLVPAGTALLLPAGH